MVNQTISESARVVLMSAVGEPPIGKPNTFSGNAPNWLSAKIKMKTRQEERHERLALGTEGAV